MDNSTALWFSEEGMEDTFVNEECDMMDYYLDEVQLSFLLEEENIPNFEPNFSISNSNSIDSSTIIPRNNSTTTLCTSSTSIEPPPVLICTEKQRPAKQRKATKSPMILTFGNPTTVQEMNHQNVNNNHREEEVLVSEVLIPSSASFANLQEAAAVVGKSCDNNTSVQKKSSSSSCAGGRKRPQSQTYDHILAERKRREQLSQQFVALSTLVPGLKKMDKTSVLGDAINYLKHLQERVKTFEVKSTKQTMESLVILKKSQVFVEDEGSSDEMSGGGGGGVGGGPDEQTLPEIEAKVCEKSVLLKVLCHRNKGVLVNLLTEIERLNLCVTNTNVAQFGTLALDITIIAEMEQEFNMTIKDLIIHLQAVLQRSNEGE